MIYDVADKAIRRMNRQNLKLFGKLKLAKWDELSIIREVKSVYDQSTEMAKRLYQEIAKDAMATALEEANAKDMDVDDTITGDWILDMLEVVDPVTLYAFLPEKERKAQRLIEALSVAHSKSAEVDKALRLWTRQVGQYADNTVYNARLAGFEKAHVKRVMWLTQEDERVCDDCWPLHRKIFPIDEVPPPQHYGCRCVLVTVRD